MLCRSLLAVALAGAAMAGPISPPSADQLERRQAQSFTGSTQNGLQGGCKANIVIFARGTTETGNVGTVVGPPFFQALAAKVGAGNLAAQGVDYPANIPGFLAGGDAAGSKTMAQLVTQAVSQCPDSNIIMSGYSQGGQLAHNAAKALPASVSSKVAAAVIFGDPDQGTPVAGVASSNTLQICHDADSICHGGDLIKTAHLTYGTQNSDQAADFISKIVSAKGAQKGTGRTGSSSKSH